MKMTSIIIPTLNEREILSNCIHSIQQFTKVPYEIIVVDNGSNDGTLEYCREQGITFISNADNRGFPAACNMGLKVACGDALLLLNNDVIVTHRWLTNMLHCLYSSKDIGIVGPLSNYASGKQQFDAGYRNIDQYHEMAWHFNRPDHKKWIQVERIVGFCMLFKRELLDQIGYLDERFYPGHYEDDDFCYRARNAGYRLMIAGDVFIHHYGSVSFRKQHREGLDHIIAQNYQKFIEKWGVNPHEFI